MTGDADVGDADASGKGCGCLILIGLVAVIVVTILFLTFCSGSQSSSLPMPVDSDHPNIRSNDAPSNSTSAEKKPDISVVGPAGNEVTLQLRPLDHEKSKALAPYIQQMGYQCADIGDANELLQEDGQSLNIFKVDCTNGSSYQVTLLSDKNYIKPWTGILLGE